jgi:RNA polymerase sigma-B factor
MAVETAPTGLRDEGSSADDRDEMLRRYAATGDVRLRDTLVEAHLGLASQLARRFASRGEPYDDLFQAASIGLLKALAGFDPDLGYEFGAYATKTIIGELKRHFRDKGWAVRAPRRLQELYLRIGSAVNDLSQSLGRSPTVAELAAELGVTEEAVLEATEAGQAYRSTSLDAPGPTGETVGSRLDDPDDAYERAEHRRLLEPHLAALPEREREIVRLRFVEDLTQSEIAARLGISQMHVSRLLSRTLAALHEACAEPGAGE